MNPELIKTVLNDKKECVSCGVKDYLLSMNFIMKSKKWICEKCRVEIITGEVIYTSHCKWETVLEQLAQQSTADGSRK